MTDLSVCLIVKNESETLAKCLESIRSIASQIVVVDTGSTDDTIKIADSFKAELFHFNWINDFSAARNYGLKQARLNWILQLDADEYLDPKSLPLLTDSILDETADAFQLVVRNYHPAQDMLAFQDSRQVRIFRNKVDFRFSGKIHEQISPALKRTGASVKNSDLLIHHEGYRFKNQEKAQRNLPLLQQAVTEAPKDAFLQFKLGETYKALKKFSLAEIAFLEAKKLGLAPAYQEILYLRLAQIYLELNHFAFSLDSAENGLLLNPENALLLYVASIAALYVGKNNLAENHLKFLLSVDQGQSISITDIEQLLGVCQKLPAGGSDS